MPKSKVVLGMDIGGTNMRFGLINEKYELSDFAIKSTEAILLTGQQTKIRLIDSVREYISEHLGERLPDAISIGFPATIDKTRRIVISVPNIKGLDNIAVADVLEKAFGIPVFINRDTNFLLLYDIFHHKLDEASIIIGCYAGTGFGNAVSIGGKILLGKNGVAAELGHIPMLGKSGICGCGNVGCIEVYASGKYLEKINECYYPDTPIKEMFSRHSGEEPVEQLVEQLSIPIATEINIFDPDHVIIGGGVIQMKDFPTQKLEERIREHTRKPYPERNLDLLYSSRRQENGVIGAGIYAYKRLDDSKYI